MKVAVWLNEDIDNKVGGGYSYAERLIKLIDEKDFSKELEVVFLSKETVKAQYKKEVIVLKSYSKKNKVSNKEKLLKRLVEKSNFLKSLYKESLKKSRAKESSIFYKKQLTENNVDVIYYLTQMESVIQNFPFIATNWDVGHLSMFAFPEVTFNNNFENRENWYNNDFKKALSIFSESEAGKEELSNYLNINPNRIKVLPIFAGGVVHQNVSSEKQNEILHLLKLEKNKYFFYPAQFWAHKNHHNLLHAFSKLKNEHSNLKLVFTGSDKGNLDYIKKTISELNLQENAIYLGFLGLEEIYTLYKNTIALVMPTFLGPTNMPLLEARALECPILCSDLKGHREQLEGGAIYFDPLDSISIYNGLTKILNKDFKKELLEKANVVNKASKFNELNVINILEKHLIDISKYRKCWA